jgi:hypothetical protein
MSENYRRVVLISVDAVKAESPDLKVRLEKLERMILTD